MNAQTAKTSAGDARPRAIPAGVRKIPTPMVPPTTSAAAAAEADPALEPGSRPCAAQNCSRRPSWKARGPPEPKTPPAVVSARPNEDERRKPGSDGSELSRASTFAKPE